MSTGAKQRTAPWVLIAAGLLPAAITAGMLWWLIPSGGWKIFGIWTEPSVIGWSTGFADLAYITATADCMSAGTDIATCDPYGRPFTPYTVIPSSVLRALGLGLQQTGVLGVGLAVIWVALVGALSLLVVTRWHRGGASGAVGLIAALAAITLLAISPAVLLGVERGTVDILIAALAAAGLLLFARPASGAVTKTVGAIALLIASILKYFAVGVFAVFLAPRRWSWIGAAAGAATIVFLIWNFEDLLVAQGTARSTIVSTTRIMFSSTTGIVTWLVPDPLAFTPPANQVLNPTLLKAVGALIFLALIALFVALLHKSQTSNKQIDDASWYLIVGGSFILAVPYLLGESNDYRLLFLLLPLTGILIWIGQGGPQRLLWPMVAALVFSCLTGSSMITNDFGFIIPKGVLIVGDITLAVGLAFGVAVWCWAWTTKFATSNS
jgi:hypothetical protein